jgi:translocation and assembly module TamB
MVLLALLAAMPVWLPWMLRPLASSLGATYAGYERVGYSRLRLNDLKVSAGAGEFRAEQVEAYVPTGWLWCLLSGRTNHAFVAINTWRFQPGAKSGAPIRPRTASVFTNLVRVESTLAKLRYWLPHARATNGTIQIRQRKFILPGATWIKGHLDSQLVLPQQRAFALNADALPGGGLRLGVGSERYQLHSDLRMNVTAEGAVFEGAAYWLSNQIPIRVEFASVGKLPSKGTVTADNFKVPGTVFGLEPYRELAGSLRVDWSAEGWAEAPGTQFIVDLAVNADPARAELPPVDVRLRASGNTNAARIDTARVMLPWLDAELASGTALQFSPPFVTEPARLEVSADLSKQGRIAASGRLDGKATVYPTTNRYPQIVFGLDGDGVTVSNLQTSSLWLEGDFEWPLVRLAGTKVVLSDGSEAALAGIFNAASNVIERGEVVITGAFGRNLLPKGYYFESLSLRAAVAGPLSKLEHSGDLEASEVRLPHAQPLAIRVAWKGTHLAFDDLDLTLSAGAASMNLQGSIAAEDGIRQLHLSGFSLHTTRQGDLELVEPISLLFRNDAGRTHAWRQWTLECEPMHWAGAGRVVEIGGRVQWPERGAVQVALTNLTTALLEDFLVFTNPPVTIQSFALDAGWTNGPMHFKAVGSARHQSRRGYDFVYDAAILGSPAGIVIQQASIASATQLVCRAQGSLPFLLTPGAPSLFQVNTQGVLHLQAFTETNSALWSELAQRLPLRLVNPHVRVDVAGTWVQPQGMVHAEVDRLEIQWPKPLPVITDLQFELTMNRETAEARFGAKIQEQPIQAEGSIPLGRGFWNGLQRGRRLPDFQQATGAVAMENAKIASFVDFAPEILAPQGEFTLNVKLARGNQLTGEALIYNAATRPLPSLGPLRALDARLLFAGRDVVLTNLSTEIGGQRVTAQGGAVLSDEVWQEKRLPAFHVQVTGSNVPLARRASALVRSDLNVGISNSLAGGATMTGRVRLRDSFFLSSLKDLAPGRVASPRRRPPYFSIEPEPFANWRLGIDVEGERFLKVRSPFFRGVVSTTLRLEGTLREPLALGEARINSGLITFPFGSLEVQQGFVSLTSGNPYHPQLFVNATAQRMGYDIRMEASGPADQPVLQFSSSPPLTSEQIVLMLTTGQTPQGVANATTTRQRAQGVAMFVGKNLLSELGIGGAGDSRLTIRSGEQVTETGRPTYDVEYKLDDDWSVTGEYDRFSQYNLGIKWRVFSK